MRTPLSPAATGVLVMAAQALAVAAGAVAALILARLLGPAGFGQAMAMVSGAMLLATVAGANLDSIALRVLTQAPEAEAGTFLRLARAVILTTTAMAALVCAAAYMLGRIDGAGAAALPVAVAVGAALRLLARVGAGLNAAAAGSLPRILARPLAFLALALASLALGAAPAPWMLLAVFALALALGLACQWAALGSRLRPLLAAASPVPARTRRRWLSAALCLLPGLLMLEMLRHLVLVAAAPRLSPPALGTLALALSLAALPALGVAAAEIAAGPRIAKAVARGDGVADALALALRLRWLGLATALCALGPGLPLALGLAGPAAEGAEHLVWILCLLPIGRAVFGNPQTLLMLRGQTAAVGLVSTLGAAGAAVAVWGAAGTLGAAGAAWAAVAAAWTVHGTLWAHCRVRTGLDGSLAAAIRRCPNRADQRRSGIWAHGPTAP